MARSRSSAKAAGTRFETLVVTFLRAWFGDHIERRAKSGAKDRGDVAGLRDAWGRRIVLEVKDYGGRLHLPEWLRQAEEERRNDQAHACAVVAKRRGTTYPLDQYVILTLGEFTKLITPPDHVTPQE